jgi:steroid delta-isomerase-like uncharacterized protein
MAEHEATATANELIAAFSAGDWSRFRATLAPDVVYEETGTGRRTEGADAYVALCQGWRDAFPDASGAIERTVASGDLVAQEVLWQGTQTGPLATASGTIPASGRTIRVAATLWYTLRDGRATAIRHHLDVLTMLGQIGALPT